MKNILNRWSPQTLQLKCISETARSKAQEFAEQLLSTYGTMATLYYRRGRVLPKRHTPDVGMVKRSQSSHGRTSHSIALVNDCNGSAKEIEMHENEKGVLISLCLSPGNETLADGRCETGYTNNLVVGAIHHLKSK